MPPAVRRPLVRIERAGRRVAYDAVAAEEPLEIRVDGVPMAVTMRSPGHDFELAAGYLLTEGVVARADQLRTMAYCGPGPERPPGAGDPGPERPAEFNVLDVGVAGADRRVEPRRFFTTSSCGLCGRASIESVRARAAVDVHDDPARFSPDLLAALPGRLRKAQRVFERTGGLHAAGLFDGAGGLVCVREDVGRHNAFDKVIGWAAMQGRLPLRGHLILASGRASFELAQKALTAGIPVLAAISAPSSLAVDLAEEAGMTLVGFLREETMNVYAGHHRVGSDTSG